MLIHTTFVPQNPFGFFPAGTPLGFHHSPFSLVPNPTANPLLQHQQQNQSQEGHPPPAAAPLPPPPSSQQQPINMTPQDSGRYIRSNEAPLSPQTPQPQAQSSSSSSSHLHHPPSHSDQPPRLPPLPQQQTHSPPWTGKLESKSGSDDEALDATMNRLTEPKNSNSMRDKQTILFDSAGKKVYACTICDFQTKQKGLLKVHINSVHYKMKIWSCDLCKFTSVQKGNLRAHVLTGNQLSIEYLGV